MVEGKSAALIERSEHSVQRGWGGGRYSKTIEDVKDERAALLEIQGCARLTHSPRAHARTHTQVT